MTNQAPNHARVVPLRLPAAQREDTRPAREAPAGTRPAAGRSSAVGPAAERPESGGRQGARPVVLRPGAERLAAVRPAGVPPVTGRPGDHPPREPLWRDLVGDVLRRERLAQERTLKDVADAARISMPYLSEIERGRKEASSEVLAAAAQALGLGLGGLLARTHGELARVTSLTAGRGRSSAGTRFDGLCLAA